jgi:hypothetical protein
VATGSRRRRLHKAQSPEPNGGGGGSHDIHWGEPTFLDLIEHIADWSRDAPILLLCLARPELLDVRPGWAAGR